MVIRSARELVMVVKLSEYLTEVIEEMIVREGR